MTDHETSSHDLHRLTALTWDASIPICFTVNFPGVPQTGYFLVPKMIPVHLCAKPMFEQLALVDAGFGTAKFKGWFEYKARFNKNHFTAVIPWSVPIGVVVDWIIALEFPSEIKAGAKDPIDKIFEDNALPLELRYADADTKDDNIPPEAILQSNFLRVDQQFAHKLWVSALLGSASEAVKLAPQIERSLRSWDPHTFFRGRRDMVKRAGDRVSNALLAFHIVQPVTERKNQPLSMITTLRLVEVGTEKMSTFGQLLKNHIFQQYSKLTADQCLSTEPLAPDLGLVRVLGMNPPLYTPLQFLRDNLCARDFALHVVVRPLPNNCVAASPTSANASPTAAGDGGGGTTTATTNTCFSLESSSHANLLFGTASGSNLLSSSTLGAFVDAGVVAGGGGAGGGGGGGSHQQQQKSGAGNSSPSVHLAASPADGNNAAAAANESSSIQNNNNIGSVATACVLPNLTPTRVASDVTPSSAAPQLDKRKIILEDSPRNSNDDNPISLSRAATTDNNNCVTVESKPSADPNL